MKRLEGRWPSTHAPPLLSTLSDPRERAAAPICFAQSINVARRERAQALLRSGERAGSKII